jgi:hypothetical protein
MPIFDDLVASGRLADLAIAVMAIEAVVLSAIFRRRRPGLLLSLLPTLSSGLFLLLALKAALQDGGHVVILACLTGSLIAHATDIALRLSLRKPQDVT